MSKIKTVSIGILFITVLLIASLPAFSGSTDFKFPRPDRMIMYNIVDPDTNRDELELGHVWMMADIVRAADLDYFLLHPEKYTVVQDPGFHVCYLGMNCRDVKPESAGVYWASPYKPGDPNYPLNITYVRLAFEFLTYKTPLFGPIYGGIVEEAYTLVPPAQGKWHNDEITPFSYSPTTAYTYLHDHAYWRFGQEAGIDPGIWVPDPDKYPNTTKLVYPDDYIPLRHLDFLFPEAAIAPTSYTFCEQVNNNDGTGWNYWLHQWAGTTGSYVNEFIESIDMYYTLIFRTFYNRDHDFYFLCYGLGLPPTLCYYVFHPSTDYVGGDNSYGLNNSELNYWLERFMYWKDPVTHVVLTEEEVVASLWQVQNLTMNAANPNCLAPTIPVYHRKFTAAFRNDLCENWLHIPGYGSYAYQTAVGEFVFSHLHEKDKQTGGTALWCNPGLPEEIHPALLRWVDDVFVANRIYGAGITRFPLNVTRDDTVYTHSIMPWFIIDWSWEPWSSTTLGVADGVKCTYRLRQDVKWQDGSPVTAEDFAWDLNFIEWCEFPDLLGTWLDHVYTEPVDDYTVNVYIDQPGQFWMEMYMGAPVFQREVWETVCYPHLWYQPEPDPLAARTKAEAFTPFSEPGSPQPHPNQPDDWPYTWPLSCESGIGQWVLKEYDIDAQVCDFYPNPYHWVTGPIVGAVSAPTRVDPGTDVEFYLIVQNVDKYNHTYTVEAEMDGETIVGAPTSGELEAFWWNKTGPFYTGALDCGEHNITLTVTDDDTGYIHTYVHEIAATIREDADENFNVDMIDLWLAARAFGSYPMHPRWDRRVDFDDNFICDMIDLWMVAKKFGWVCPP